jgi:predicted NAD/FAD-dependent oxidoreductase
MKQTGSSPACLVLGAGMSGLAAAVRLRESGVPAILLDKGRRPGGRMATRRLRHATAGTGVFDHGAQFLTARSKAFRARLAPWLAEGTVAEWCRGFPGSESPPRPAGGAPRYRGREGMKSVSLALAAGLDIRTQVRVTAAVAEGPRWRVFSEDGATFPADLLLLTAPVPQSLAVLAAGSVRLPAPRRRQLAAVRYEPCAAVLALLDRPSLVPAPGAVRADGNPLAWIADNNRKGISPGAHAVTLHGGPAFSQRAFDMDDEAVARALLAAACRWIVSDPAQVHVHRWRYARPSRVGNEPCLVVQEPAPMVFAGDALGGPRVEGAFLSGLAAAEAALRLLPPGR